MAINEDSDEDNGEEKKQITVSIVTKDKQKQVRVSYDPS